MNNRKKDYKQRLSSLRLQIYKCREVIAPTPSTPRKPFKRAISLKQLRLFSDKGPSAEFIFDVAKRKRILDPPKRHSIAAIASRRLSSRVQEKQQQTALRHKTIPRSYLCQNCLCVMEKEQKYCSKACEQNRCQDCRRRVSSNMPHVNGIRLCSCCLSLRSDRISSILGLQKE